MSHPLQTILPALRAKDGDVQIMQTLVDGGQTGRTGAVFSPAGSPEKYRYLLWREVNPAGQAALNATMLNPSYATHERSDNTVSRCCGWAKDWGYRWLVVTNLFALRSPYPTALRRSPNPVGRLNDAAILAAVRHTHMTLLAWGNDGMYLGRSKQVLSMIEAAGLLPRLHYLQLTKFGHPHHPRGLRADLSPVPWKIEEKPHE